MTVVRPLPPRRAALLASAALLLGGGRASAQGAWPELALRTQSGQPLLPDTPGWRATYVDFWASWCAPCKLSFPWMNEMLERLGPAGLRIVAINVDRREADAQRFLQRWPARFELAFDPLAEAAARLAIQAMPTSMLVARDRRILFTHRGFRLEDRAELEARLRAALA
jgi:cytochrome c biogenesis protein CcmG/thiol:disulfide interchange protein DsbE